MSVYSVEMKLPAASCGVSNMQTMMKNGHYFRYVFKYSSTSLALLWLMGEIPVCKTGALKTYLVDACRKIVKYFPEKEQVTISFN